MLRALIGTGLLLMALGFGAAGWQYWKSLPPSEVAAVGQAEPAVPDADPARAATPPQSWLVSPTGGVVPQADASAYLVQDRFVPGRTVVLLRLASLADLLVEGEKLPDAPFLQVLADIRAPRVAEGLCAVMTAAIAQDCAVNAARVVEGSVDPVAGTAQFRLELVFRLKDPGADLPDLAANVLQSETVPLDLEAGAEGGSSPDALLAAALSAVATACAAEKVGAACRPLRFELDWVPGQAVKARAQIAWLDPLPKGMVVAPPLDTVPGG